MILRFVWSDHAKQLNSVLIGVNLMNLRSNALKLFVLWLWWRFFLTQSLTTFVLFDHIFDILQHSTEIIWFWFDLIIGRQFLFWQKIYAFVLKLSILLLFWFLIQQGFMMIRIFLFFLSCQMFFCKRVIYRDGTLFFLMYLLTITCSIVCWHSSVLPLYFSTIT